jgi:hypothetical protein
VISDERLAANPRAAVTLARFDVLGLKGWMQHLV